MRITGDTVFGRLAFTFLLICAIALGAAVGLLFVYSSDLPEIRALEDYRPNVVTELYADDGQQIGTFALQRRILLTWEQIPPVLKTRSLPPKISISSSTGAWICRAFGGGVAQHAPRAASREGASTLTMQLAGGLFLDRSDRSFRRKIQETLLAIQIERHLHEAADLHDVLRTKFIWRTGITDSRPRRNIISASPLAKLTLAGGGTARRLIRGPVYSPITHPQNARWRDGIWCCD